MLDYLSAVLTANLPNRYGKVPKPFAFEMIADDCESISMRLFYISALDQRAAILVGG
jgi:hypothetical protein